MKPVRDVFPNRTCESQVCKQRAIFLLVTKHTSHWIPQMQKCKAISMFVPFFRFHMFWVIQLVHKEGIKKHHLCPKTWCWWKIQGKAVTLETRDWRNWSFGLERDRNLVCEAGDIWEWKRGGEHCEAPPLLSQHLCCGTGSTSTTTMRLYKLRLCYSLKESMALIWLWRQVSQSNNIFTVFKINPLWSKLAMLQTAGYIMLNNGVPWGAHES